MWPRGFDPPSKNSSRASRLHQKLQFCIDATAHQNMLMNSETILCLFCTSGNTINQAYVTQATNDMSIITDTNTTYYIGLIRVRI